jgi:hypothetical protein
MAQAPRVCSPDPSWPTTGSTVSTGLPSTSSSSSDPHTTAPERPHLPAPRRGASLVATRRWAASPVFERRELSLVALAGLLVALLVTWPLVAHMSSRISPDLGDPVRTAWEVAWVGHAMLHDPTHLFDANAFYPHPLSLAFSDSLLGYGPTAFFGSGTVAALVRYNLLFLFTWWLCLFAGYLLARELGLGKLGGAAAALAFAYAPYRVTEAGHLHVLSSGGIALALFLLLRGYRRDSRWLVGAGWLVSAWQVSLGFTLGLQYCYLLAVLALLIGWQWWQGGLARARTTAGTSESRGPEESADTAYPARGRDRGERATSRGPLVTRQTLAVTAVGVLLTAVVGVYQARPYLRVSRDYPTAKRSLTEVKKYSAGPAALLSASSENRVWGGVTGGLRDTLSSKNESVLFAGGLIGLLALIGLVLSRGSPFTPRLRLGLLAGVIVCSVLAMGFGLTGAGYPYRLLYDYAPGWDGVRVPGRVFTLATLFYALLAGAGAQVLAKRARELGASRSFPSLGAVVGVLLLIGILGEGAGHMGHPEVPQPQPAEVGLRGPLLDLPTDDTYDRIWQYFSTDGFYDIPVGNSTFNLPVIDDLRGGMAGFPDRASVEKLRYWGIKTVVLHTEPFHDLPGEHGFGKPEPQDTASAARKPVAGLGISARHAGSLVIYEIGPGPAALHGGG